MTTYWQVGLLSLFVALAVMELLWQERPAFDTDRRIAINFGLGAIGLILSSAAPFGAAAGAIMASRSGWTLLGTATANGLWAFVVYFLARSFGLYWSHRAFHASPTLWRIHRLHHSDKSVDLSTTLRAHPVEIVAAMILAFTTAALIGASADVVIAGESMLFATNLWTHANIHVPVPADRLLGLFIVTPDAHRVHHSVDRAVADSNYGESISMWDRLFGTWRGGARVERFGIAPPQRDAN